MCWNEIHLTALRLKDESERKRSPVGNENLPYDDSGDKIIQKLSDEDAHGLLVIYHNWSNRLIQSTPRQVRKSSAYKESQYRETFSVALSAIEKDVRQGNELTKYLSKGVRAALKLPGRHRGASDRDMLLNDWGVHHLHLSTELQSDGFVERTGPLLFARFNRDTAYFLYLADHGEWAKEAVADALISEFPDAGGVSVLKGVVGVSQEYTDDEHQRLRADGVNISRMVGDRAVVGGFYNSQGHTIAAVRGADRILTEVESFENEWKNNEEEFRISLMAQGVELPVDTNFEFKIDENGPLIVETNSGTKLRVF